ncbi:hypothetical protein [Glutamicibacter sp. TV12E]|uniref:hypothetical protein n=1 Tax=Glutamicibacter sp. TV12E TaxID=3446362 RepID=UPI0040341E32
MDSSFALDPLEVSILLLWGAGLIYVGCRYVQRRSVPLLFMLMAALCIPGFGVCYAAVQLIRNVSSLNKQV